MYLGKAQHPANLSHLLGSLLLCNMDVDNTYQYTFTYTIVGHSLTMLTRFWPIIDHLPTPCLHIPLLLHKKISVLIPQHKVCSKRPFLIGTLAQLGRIGGDWRPQLAGIGKKKWTIPYRTVRTYCYFPYTEIQSTSFSRNLLYYVGWASLRSTSSVILVSLLPDD